MPEKFYVAFWTRGGDWRPCGRNGGICDIAPHIAFSPEEFPVSVRYNDVGDWVVMEFEL